MNWETLDATLAARNTLYELGYAAGLNAAVSEITIMAPNGDDNFSEWQRQAIALILEKQ